VIVSVAVFEPVPSFAVITANVFADTNCVSTAKLIDVLPAGTVTVVGTNALALEDLSATMAPPDGAVPFKFTEQMAVSPSDMAAGLKATDLSVEAWTVMLLEFDAPLSEALIVDDLVALTPEVAIVKVADFMPGAIVTLDGTVTKEAGDASLTEIPPLGAALESFTVPVAELPPTTDVGDADTEVTV